MPDLDAHRAGLRRFATALRRDPDTLVTVVALLLVGTWFLREVFGVLPLGSPRDDLLFNVVVLAAAIAALRVTGAAGDPILGLWRTVRTNVTLRGDPWLLLVVTLFLLKMLAVVSWDLPYHYHPGDDEYIVPSMYFSRFDISAAITNPNRSQNPLFDNQHLMYYVLTPYYLLLNVGGLLGRVPDYYLAARLLNYGFATLVVVLTYVNAKKLFGRTAAVAAILPLPLTRQFGHYALFMRSDVLLTLLASVLLLAFVVLARTDRQNHVVPGILVGLGTALKPYALVFLLPFGLLVLADLVDDADYRGAAYRAAQLATGTLVAFHFGRFYHTYLVQGLGAGFLTSIGRASSAHALYPDPGGLLERMAFTVTLLRWWNGVTLTALLLVGLVVLALVVRRRNRLGAVAVLAFVLPLSLVVGAQVVKSGRYWLPILPIALVGLGGAFAHLYERRPPVVKGVVVVLFVASLVQPALITGAWTYTLTQEDHRTQARDWVVEHAEPGSDVSFHSFPSWQKPRIPRDRYDVHVANDETDYLIVTLGSYHRVKYYVEEGYSSERVGRFVDHPMRAMNVTRQVFDGGETLTVNGRRYERVAVFRKDQEFLGYSLDDYHRHPASFDVWGVTHPLPVYVYRPAR